MEGLLKMNTVLNSKSESTYMNLGREESVSHQGLKVIQGGQKIPELWESGCRELSLHVRLMKFITWLSKTNPWPFKIIQLLDPPASI